MWAKLSSFAPHLLHNGLSDGPSNGRRLLRVLCPVRRLITTLDCVLLKDKSLVFAAGLRPEINLNPVPEYYKDFAAVPNTGYPSSVLPSYILPRDLQGWLRSNKLFNRTISCKLVGDFVSLYPSMSRVPLHPHSMPSRIIIQCLLALSYQWRHCFDSLKGFQSLLAIRVNNHVFLRSTICLISYAQAKVAYILAQKTVAYLPREILSLLPRFP
jgi:hypothetical protein